MRHWLAFFEDEALARNDLKLFRDVFGSIAEHASTGQAPRGGSGMN